MAEEYRQKYLDKNLGGYCHVDLSLANKPLYDESKFKVPSKDELKVKLSDLQYAVTQEKSTDVVTISMKEVIFKEPVFIGDIVSCYEKVTNVGNTSITTAVKVVVERLNDGGFLECVPVTTAQVTYVSVDKSGNKKPISAELKRLHGFLN